MKTLRLLEDNEMRNIIGGAVIAEIEDNPAPFPGETAKQMEKADRKEDRHGG